MSVWMKQTTRERVPHYYCTVKQRQANRCHLPFCPNRPRSATLNTPDVSNLSRAAREKKLRFWKNEIASFWPIPPSPRAPNGAEAGIRTLLPTSRKTRSHPPPGGGGREGSSPASATSQAPGWGARTARTARLPRGPKGKPSRPVSASLRASSPRKAPAPPALVTPRAPAVGSPPRTSTGASPSRGRTRPAARKVPNRAFKPPTRPPPFTVDGASRRAEAACEAGEALLLSRTARDEVRTPRQRRRWRRRRRRRCQE